MLLRDHYYSANKWRIVEIKWFSIGAETTAVLVPKRLCLVVSSRSVRWQLNRKSSAADGGKFQIRYFQAIGAGRAECSSTRYVNDTSEWSQVSRHSQRPSAFAYSFSKRRLSAVSDIAESVSTDLRNAFCCPLTVSAIPEVLCINCISKEVVQIIEKFIRGI